MTRTLDARLLALETDREGGGAKPLPCLVPDTTTDAELDRMRRDGREVYRESDPAFIDRFV